jgi:hypothetical protein
MWKNIFRNWKTSVAGAAAVASVLVPALSGPGKLGNVIAIISDPAKLGTITAGIGLVLAKDGDKTGVGSHHVRQQRRIGR